MSESAPPRLAVVVGTGTEVGKTWIAAAVIRVLVERGLTVAARKPVQSFEPGDPATDADVLAAATGEDPSTVCPPHRWYEVAMAPPMAADALGRAPFELEDLYAEITWPDDIDVGLVESAGGVRSPLASDDADAVGLTAALQPDVIVLVADAGLGTINAVRLTVGTLASVLAARDEMHLVVVLNRFDDTDDLHRRNRDWLRDRDDLDVVTDVAALADRLTGG